MFDRDVLPPQAALVLVPKFMELEEIHLKLNTQKCVFE